ncbi:sugar transferase, partial [Aeromicrobium fastidiosum]|nr:sugar transferase [Aeromicrobium fastidiosum]
MFIHRRIGRGGRMFPCLKLRTMVRDSEVRLRRHLEQNPEAQAEWALDQKLRNDPRITPLGRFLRKSSLDELPQLINVVWGHMSMVGPRPIVPAEVERYGRYMQFYCTMRPGITGLWQV